MLTNWNIGELFCGGLTSFGLSVSDWCVLLCGILLLAVGSRLGKKRPMREWFAERPILLCAGLCLVVIAILLFGAYGIGYDASQFIYNQF